MAPSSRVIAFFSDRAMLPGLHAALASLAVSNRETPFDLVVFADGLSERDKEQLADTWARQSVPQPIVIRDFEAVPFEGANSLHGNYTVYGRLFLADLLPEYSGCVYLDSDLVVNLSVEPLFDAASGDATLAGVLVGARDGCLDHDLYSRAGLDLTGEFFNSGVLAINLARYREINGLEKCRQAAMRYPGTFNTADQALLNAVFHDDFTPLDRRFNTGLQPPVRRLTELESKIYHFAGSPKPWEPFCSRLHPNHWVWRHFYAMSALRDVSPWRYVKPYRLLRVGRQAVWAMLAQWRK